jgi:lipoprotein NlpI
MQKDDHVEFFLDTISSFCGLKSIDINKANNAKNVRHNIEFIFSHHKKVQKENMIEPCDVICHVTVAFYIYHFIGALTLYV